LLPASLAVRATGATSFTVETIEKNTQVGS
jgi:hypothetical protein